jgi:succinate-acetate transporter protein
MTTARTRKTNGRDGEPTEDSSAEWSFWREHSTISLQPIAAPSILGLFGFAVSTFIVAANMAGWFGDGTVTPLVLFPFAFAFGGIAQLLAAMWSYRARDALATGIHGAWGSFWIGYGLYMVLVALHLAPGTTDPRARVAFGYWFIGLAAVTWTGFAAAWAENLALSLVLLTLASGSTLLAIGMVAALPTVVIIGAIVLIASAVLAWYTASAMLLRASFSRAVLPTGTLGGPQAPGATERRPVQFRAGEPGIKRGQ